MSRAIIKEANNLFRNRDFSAALSLYREVQKTYPELSKLFDLNIQLCEKHSGVGVSGYPEIFITLTTISGRLDHLAMVIESLHNQILKPTKILLNLSEEPYLLDNGVSKNDPRLTDLFRFPLLDISWVRNTGPYRKIMPFMEQFYSEELVEDKIFITVDDDTIYPDYFIQTLYENYIQYDCVIAFRGRFITVNDSAIQCYSKWLLGKTDSYPNNLPTGKDGIIYSTKFFTKEFVDFDAALKLAPTADDLWIKWHCGLNGVKAVILKPEAATSDYKSFPVVDYSSAYRDVSLYAAHNSSGAGGKNDISVSALEKYFMGLYGYNLFSLCVNEQ